MCGIAGFAGRGSLEDLRRMNAAQRHRGPDGEGTYVDPEFAVHLGHQRLAVLDIEGGHQPMWTADGALGIVFNGEIYNHAELRHELRALGAQFRTDHSDTEVLLHAYRQWGDGFVERLNGMWAFVIYDRPRRRLFGSRDRFGEKPLYYFASGNLFAFASDLSSLRAHPATPQRISALGLQKFFAYGYIPAPHCYLEGVRKLPAGHSFQLSLPEHKLQVTRYWSYEIQTDRQLEAATIDDIADELLARLKTSVSRRLIADVPVGTFLSGGLDSSTISALAASILPAGRLNTFSVGFDERSFDESGYASLVAGHIHSTHHQLRFSKTEATKCLPRIIRALDEPHGDSSFLPTWFLCRHARQKVTVALGGDGADELFAGYAPFLALRWANLYQNLVPTAVHEALIAVAAKLPVSHRYMSLDFKIKRTLRGLHRREALWCPIWMAPVAPRDLAELFDAPVSIEQIYEEAIECWERTQAPSRTEKLIQFYVNLYLQDDILTKLDRASMAHSLEVRSPFLDVDVADFARSLPVQFLMAGNVTKIALRKAAAKLLPKRILTRSKQGFGIPIGQWFKDGSLALPERFPDGVNSTLARKLGQAHQTGSRDERLFLWCAKVVEQPKLAIDSC